MGEKFALAVDIGGSGFRLAVFTKNAAGLYKSTVSRVSYDKGSLTSDELLRALSQRIVYAMHGRSVEDFLGIGIAVAALVDPKTGLLINPHFAALQELKIPLSQIMVPWGYVPCKVVNDAQAAAYVEWKYGAAKDKDRVAFFVVSTGIGGATVKSGLAVNREFGQIIVPTTWATGERDAARLEEVCGTHWFKAQEPYLLEPKELAERAREGDKEAANIFSLMGATLGCAVSSVVGVWEPDIVVFGGGISLSSDLFLPMVNTQMLRLKAPWVTVPPLVPAHFGAEASLFGAAALVLS